MNDEDLRLGLQRMYAEIAYLRGRVDGAMALMKTTVLSLPNGGTVIEQAVARLQRIDDASLFDPASGEAYRAGLEATLAQVRTWSSETPTRGHVL